MTGTSSTRPMVFAANVLLVAGAATAGAPIAAAQDAGATLEEGAVYVEADEVFDDQQNNRYIARGGVEARYGERTLRAEELIYFRDTGRVIARGGVTLIQADGTVNFADEVEFSESLETGVISGFATRFPSNATIAADYALRNEGDANEFERAFYTACVPCGETAFAQRPSWRLRARRVRQDLNDSMIYYRDAVLEVKGVPVLYAPFFAHADPAAERRSGFLLPATGESSATGTFVELPYYWAISDYQDLTLTPRIMSDAAPLIGFEHRKAFFSGETRFQGSLTSEQEFDEDGDKFGDEVLRGHVFGSGSFRVNEDWIWGFGAEAVSDDLYFRRYQIDDEQAQRGLFQRGRQRLLNQVFAVRAKEDSVVTVGAMRFQGLRAGENEGELPLVLPFVDARSILADSIAGGRLEGRASIAAVQRNLGVDSHRVTGELDWQARMTSASGLVFSPFALARADAYYVSDFTTDSGEDVDGEAFSRFLGHVGADLSWPVGRPLGDAGILVVEPTIKVVAAPRGGNDERIPNQDSAFAEFDEGYFLADNRSPGYDLWEPGARLTLGTRATARLNENREASVFIGQAFRDTPAEIFSQGSGLPDETSDYIGEFMVRPFRQTQLTASVRLDNQDLDVQRLAVRGSTEAGPLSLSASYKQFDETLSSGRPSEEATVNAGVRVTNNWGVYYNAGFDLETDDVRSSAAGLVYRDNCTRLELIYKRDGTSDREVGPSESIRFQFTLNTIGSFGRRR